MRLSIQTLGHHQEVVEVDETKETFDDLREKIRQAFAFPDDMPLMLIHQTHLINKTNALINTVERIKDGDKLIVMRKRPGAQPPAAQPAAAQPAAAQPAATQPAAAEEPQAAPVASPTPAAPVSPAVPTSTDPTNTLIMGEEAEKVIDNIESMGFPREQVVLAMRAAFNNPNRAVEYLMNGIPAQVPPTQQASAEPFPAPDPNTTTAPPPMEDEDESSALRQQEMLMQFRRLVQENPQQLPAFIAQFGQQNPELLQLISQNPEQLARLLSQPLGNEGGAEPTQIVVNLTQEESNAVERLCNLGFARDQVIQAYIACERDENAAANYLFDNADDE